MNQQDFCEKMSELGLAFCAVAIPLSLDGFVDLGIRLLAEAKPRQVQFDALVDLGQRLLEEDRANLTSFRRLFMEHPDVLRWELLGQSALRRKKLPATKRRQLDILGKTPDLLGPARGRFDERLHTEVIAWVLDPFTPNLGGRPLEALIARFDALNQELGQNTALPFPQGSRRNARVRPEVSVPPHGRVDIWISTDEFVLVVEAKVLATEGKSQLPGYLDAAKTYSNGRVWGVMFLTADAEQEPSVQVPHLTFEQLLSDWLPIAAEGTSNEHAYLASYLASVAKVIGIGASGDFDDWDFYTRRRALDLIDA